MNLLCATRNTFSLERRSPRCIVSISLCRAYFHLFLSNVHRNKEYYTDNNLISLTKHCYPIKNCANCEYYSVIAEFSCCGIPPKPHVNCYNKYQLSARNLPKDSCSYSSNSCPFPVRFYETL